MPPIDLQFNYPILGTEAEMVAAYLRGIDVSSITAMSASQPGAGLPKHRSAAADFLHGYGLHAPPECVFLVAGGHAALTVAIHVAYLHGTPVAVDTLTYSNFLSLAAAHAMQPIPCATDADGMLPDALIAAAKAGARSVYLMPTVHNPLGRVMPLARRRALAKVAQTAGLTVLEDDAYAFLEPSPPPTIASLLPEQTFHVYSFSKPFAPLLKAAILTVPGAVADDVEQAAILGSSGTSLFFTDLLTYLITTGLLQGVIDGKRAEGTERQRIARALLPHCRVTAHPGSYHLWVEPERISADDLCTAAAAAGVLLSPGSGFTPPSLPAPNACRLALGGEANRSRLQHGLLIVADLLRTNAV